MKRIALLSDTHGLMRPEVLEHVAGVEMILHLGDVGRPAVLERLNTIAPVVAVRGNVDWGAWTAALPTTLTVDVFGADAYLIHNLDELDLDPVAAGVRYVFYGHTHQPAHDERDGVVYVNPGSIGPRRFRLPISLALLRENGAVEFLEFDPA